MSHLGGRGNRPRWLAMGMMISALGLLLAFSTCLIYPPTAISGGCICHYLLDLFHNAMQSIATQNTRVDVFCFFFRNGQKKTEYLSMKDECKRKKERNEKEKDLVNNNDYNETK